MNSKRWFARFGATSNDSLNPMNELLITTHDSFYYDFILIWIYWFYYDYYLHLQQLFTEYSHIKHINRENNQKYDKMSGFLSDISWSTNPIRMLICFYKIGTTRIGKWLKIWFNFGHKWYPRGVFVIWNSLGDDSSEFLVNVQRSFRLVQES